MTMSRNAACHPPPARKINGMISRQIGLVCIAMLVAVARSPAQNLPTLVRLQIDPNTVISRISPNFMGFGFETSAVAQSNYFSATNFAMIQLYRNLSPHGLMRIGGIISDHTKYVADGTPVARTLNGVTVINQKNLADLADFARATGWKVMWGLNLGTGSEAEAVQEAMAVGAALGTNLQSFEIGNEVEALRRFSRNYEAYHAAYVNYKSTIRAALPDAPFSGPDVIGNWVWIANFAATEGRDMKLLTQHYYRGGAKDPETSLAKLLRPDDEWRDRLEKLRQVSHDDGLSFRINEVNSFSGGGKQGVSDTFGSALWCLDYMFLLASYGCDGVNMETDINQLGFISHYSPIVHEPSGRCHVRPEYYGMLAFAMAGHGEMVKTALEKSDANLSAYATRDNGGHLWITVVNKDFARDAALEVELPRTYSSAKVFRLLAQSIESKDRVTLAGSEVSADGSWTPGPGETLTSQNNTARFSVPHASAALLTLSAANGLRK
jgi:hypothetical protein